MAKKPNPSVKGGASKTGKHKKHKGDKNKEALSNEPSLTNVALKGLVPVPAVGVNEGGGGGDIEQEQRLKPLPSVVSNQDFSISSFQEIVGLNDEGHPYIDINRLIYQPPAEEEGSSYQNQKEKVGWYVPDFTFIILNLLSLGVSTYFLVMGDTTLQWKAGMQMFSFPDCEALLIMKDKDHPPGNAAGRDAPEAEGVATMTPPAKASHNPHPQPSSNITLSHWFYLPCKRLKFDPAYNHHDQAWPDGKTFFIFKTWLGDTQPHYIGLVLMVLQMVNIINVVFGISACLKGIKFLLIQHIVVDGILILGEITATLIIAITGFCDPEDLSVVRVLMSHFVRFYGTSLRPPPLQSVKEKELTSQVDALQRGLECCGVDSWVDYLPSAYPNYDRPSENLGLDWGQEVIPASCCRRWWLRNIYCSRGAHLWAQPTATAEQAKMFDQRIYGKGCLTKLDDLCEKIRFLVGWFGFGMAILHLIIVTVEGFAASILVKDINKMILNEKRAMKRKEIMHDPGDSGSDLDLSQGGKSITGTLGREGSSPWSKVAPPTEDEIYTIKQRSNFNKFTAAMKYGRVGSWMADAVKRVTEGHEDAHELEPQTAEERKAREKELLHGKQKKDEDHYKRRGGVGLTDKAQPHVAHVPHHHARQREAEEKGKKNKDKDKDKPAGEKDKDKPPEKDKPPSENEDEGRPPPDKKSVLFRKSVEPSAPPTKQEGVATSALPPSTSSTTTTTKKKKRKKPAGSGGTSLPNKTDSNLEVPEKRKKPTGSGGTSLPHKTDSYLEVPEKRKKSAGSGGASLPHKTDSYLEVSEKRKKSAGSGGASLPNKTDSYLEVSEKRKKSAGSGGASLPNKTDSYLEVPEKRKKTTQSGGSSPNRTGSYLEAEAPKKRKKKTRSGGTSPNRTGSFLEVPGERNKRAGSGSGSGAASPNRTGSYTDVTETDQSRQQSPVEQNTEDSESPSRRKRRRRRRRRRVKNSERKPWFSYF